MHEVKGFFCKTGVFGIMLKSQTREKHTRPKVASPIVHRGILGSCSHSGSMAQDGEAGSGGGLGAVQQKRPKAKRHGTVNGHGQAGSRGRSTR